MAAFTIVRTFVLTIFFNTILPTGDVYSDIFLMIQTWTFQNTDSLEMVGCRSCFGKSEEDFYTTVTECDTCLTKNTYFQCGGHLSSMKNFYEIQNEKQCENQKWVVSDNAVKEGECDSDHYCCFETRNNNSKIKYRDEPKIK